MSRSLLLVALAPSLAAAAPCEQRGAVLADARLVDEGHVVACYASCWSFDLATRAWTPTGPLPHAAEPPPPAVPPGVPATFTTTLVPCKTCKELTAVDVAPYAGARVDFNEDHSLVAVQASFTTVNIFDANTEKRLATIRAWKTPMGPAYQSWVLTGDRFIAFVSYSPVSSVGRIFDARTGKRVADVGDGTDVEEDAIAVGRPALRMFRKFDSGVRWLQDLTSGRVVQRFDVGNDGVRLEAQAHGVFVGLGAGHPLVVYDIAANKQAHYEVPTCK